MVARGFERIGQTGEQIVVVVMDAIDFSVHQTFGADDFSAGGLADGLMAEADAEDGKRPENFVTAAQEMPASLGVQGPGEMIRCVGFSRSISSTVI